MLKFLSRILCLLPYKAILMIGRAVGHLYYYIVSHQRYRAKERIKKSFGYTDDQADITVRAMFRKLGQSFLEILSMPRLTRNNVHEYVKLENRHYLDEAVAQGQGVVLLTAHLGNWEWMGAALALYGYPVTSVIKRQPNDQHTKILNEYRQKAGIEVFSRGTTEIIGAAKAVKKGKILGFFIDQDGGYNGIFVPFLGQMASTPQGPTTFARKFKCPVVPVFIVRKDQGGHKIIMQPPVFYESTGNEQSDDQMFTLRLNQIVEDMILKYPDNWLWFQKRWNTPYTESKAGGENE